MNKIYIALLATLLVDVLPTFAEDDLSKLSSEKFLEIVRRPRLVNTWGIFSGSVEHKREEATDAKGFIHPAKKAKAKIRMAMRFSSDAVIGQIVFNSSEIFSFAQFIADEEAGVQVTQEKKAADGELQLQKDFGIRPSDFSFSFLYWKFLKELPTGTVSLHSCRVMELMHESGEYVRVWLSSTYAFPMKVEWYTNMKKRYRTLEFKDLKEVGEEGKKMSVIESFKVSNPGWKTIVKFDKISVHRVADKPIPKDIFVKVDKPAKTEMSAETEKVKNSGEGEKSRIEK